MTEPASEALDRSDPARTFIHDLEFDYEPIERGMRGTLTLTPEVMAPESGSPLVSVLATVADVFTGMPLSLSSPPTVPLTVDLVVRVLRPVPLGRYAIEAYVVKPGRTITLTEATIRDGDETVAHCWATFVPFELPGPMPSSSASRTRVGDGGLDRMFMDAIGVVIDAPGIATIDKRAYTMQPAGTIQGGAISGLVEAAATSILGAPLRELDVRFLAPVRTGPARATAVKLDVHTVRVTVVDVGGDHDRPTAVAVARS